jgi:hypothetical protein
VTGFSRRQPIYCFVGEHQMMIRVADTLFSMRSTTGTPVDRVPVPRAMPAFARVAAAARRLAFRPEIGSPVGGLALSTGRHPSHSSSGHFIGLRGGGGDAGTSDHAQQVVDAERRELTGKRDQLRSWEHDLLLEIAQHPEPVLGAAAPPLPQMLVRYALQNRLRRVRQQIDEIERQLLGQARPHFHSGGSW